MNTLSAFIICHKNVSFLLKAAKSLANQTREPSHSTILVTDHGFTNEDLVRDVSQLCGIPVEYSPTSLTCAGSKNYAASHSMSSAFFTLDADDYLEPEFVEKCFGRLEESGADAVGCAYWQETPSGTKTSVDLPTIPNIKKANPLPSCSIISKAAYLKTPGFLDILYDDWAMWMRLSLLGCKLERLDNHLFTYVRHPGALTQPEKHDLAMQQLESSGLL